MHWQCVCEDRPHTGYIHPNQTLTRDTLYVQLFSSSLLTDLWISFGVAKPVFVEIRQLKAFERRWSLDGAGVGGACINALRSGV